MSNLFQINYECALENFDILKNLQNNTKLYVDNNNKIYIDTRWMTSIRRYAEGSSRKDIIQPIYQTFMRLVGRNEIPKEDLLECIDHLNNVFSVTYSDEFEELGELLLELRVYVNNCGTSRNNITTPNPKILQNVCVDDSLDIPQIDVEHIMAKAKQDAEQRAERTEKMIEVFKNMIDALNVPEELEETEDIETETEEFEETEDIETETEELEETDETVEDEDRVLINRIQSSVDNVMHAIQESINKNTTYILRQRLTSQHPNEVRIDIPNHEFEFSFDELNETNKDCFDRLYKTVGEVSNNIYYSFTRIVNDITSVFVEPPLKRD